MILPSYLVCLASMINGKSSLNDELLHVLSYFREIDPYDIFFLVPYETSQYSNMFPNKMVEQHTFYYMATVYGHNLMYGPNIKSKCSCSSSECFYCISVNPKNLDTDFVLPNFNLCLFENQADEETE